MPTTRTPKRIAARIRVSSKFERFVEQTLTDETLLKRVATDPASAMRKSGILRKDSPLAPPELKTFYKAIIALREAAMKDLGRDLSYRDIFNTIFGDAIGKRGPVAGEDTGCHTGYNEGWSNSSGKTASTSCGTHRIFHYDLTKGPLLDPGEAVMLQNRILELATSIGRPRSI